MDMKIKKRGKKAEISSATIISTILAIIGFALIIFIFYEFNWNLNTDKEVCHETVVYRGLLPSAGGAKDLVPLKCDTQKICITAGIFGGDCKTDFGNSPVLKVKVKNIEQIEKEIATDIVDCWSMMGKGKINVANDWFVQTYGIGKVGSSCVVCSRVAFDKAGLEKAGITDSELAKMDVMRYMGTHLVPGGNVTYLDYIGEANGAKVQIKDNFDRSVPNITISNAVLKEQDKSLQPVSAPADALAVGEGNLIEKKDLVDLKENLTQNLELQSKELAIVFMQVTAPTHSGVLRNSAITAGAFAFTPVGSLTGTVLSKVPHAAVATAAVAVLVGIYQQGSVAYNRAVTAGYCGDVSVGDEARDGCSVVRTMNYNADDLSKFCSAIESNP